jgi:hypothetical protein
MMLAAQGYEIAVEGSPEFAIKAAVRAYMRNEVKDQHPTFRPSPPAFITEVKRQIFLRVRRESKPEPVEQIVKPTEAERAALVEAARKLIPKPKRLPARTPDATEEQLSAARLALRLAELNKENAA